MWKQERKRKILACEVRQGKGQQYLNFFFLQRFFWESTKGEFVKQKERELVVSIVVKKEKGIVAMWVKWEENNVYKSKENNEIFFSRETNKREHKIWGFSLRGRFFGCYNHRVVVFKVSEDFL